MQILLQTAIFLLGASLYSFLALFAERREAGIDWISTRSRCDKCHRAIPPYFLVPVFGYLLRLGRCDCGYRIPLRHFVGEIAAGVLFSAAVAHYSIGATGFLGGGVAVYFLYLAQEDAEYRAVYTLDLLFGIGSLVIFAILAREIYPLSGLAIFLLFRLLTLLFPAGVGDGDAYYAAALALLLPGVYLAFLFFTVSFSMAAVYGVMLLFQGKSRKEAVAMYPFLLAGFIIMRLWIV